MEPAGNCTTSARAKCTTSPARPRTGLPATRARGATTRCRGPATTRARRHWPRPRPRPQPWWLREGRGRGPGKARGEVMRVGIIGCGKIADGHAEQLRALDGVDLVAACDREPLMVGQFTDRWPGVSGYGDVAAMLAAERLDVVHVATPPDSHVALACLALDAGCHVFVEKPFALDAAGARQILDCAARNGR